MELEDLPELALFGRAEAEELKIEDWQPPRA
jgi:hypothetical protein